MAKIRVMLNDEDKRVCQELFTSVRVGSPEELFRVSVGFLLDNVLPIYEKGGNLVLQSPDGKEVVCDWKLERNLASPSAGHIPRDVDGKSELLEVDFADDDYNTLIKYAPGGRVEFLTPLVRFALNTFRSVIYHSRQGGTLVQVRKNAKSTVSIEKYLRTRGDTPASDLLGGLK